MTERPEFRDMASRIATLGMEFKRIARESDAFDILHSTCAAIVLESLVLVPPNIVPKAMKGVDEKLKYYMQQFTIQAIKEDVYGRYKK